MSPVKHTHTLLVSHRLVIYRGSETDILSKPFSTSCSEAVRYVSRNSSQLMRVLVDHACVDVDMDSVLREHRGCREEVWASLFSEATLSVHRM